MTFNWRNERNAAPTYNTVAQLKDSLLRLDSVVTEAITEILTKAGVKIRPGRTENKTTGNNSEEANEAQVQADKFDSCSTLEFKPEKTDQDSATVSPLHTNLPVVQNNQDNREKQQPQKHLEIVLGASPFVPAGEATSLTKFGLFPACNINLLFPINPKLQIGLGVYSALNYFQTTELVLTFPIYYLPVGLDLRLIISSDLPFAFYIHASGGPAFNWLILNQAESITRLTFYASGGIGLNLAFSPGFGFTIDSSFIVFFENTFPIMGFNPAAGLYCRF